MTYMRLIIVYCGHGAPKGRLKQGCIVSLRPVINFEGIHEKRLLLQRELPLAGEFVCRTLRTVGIGESQAADRIGKLLQPLLAQGPVTVTATAGGQALAPATLAYPGPFEFTFALPASLTGTAEMPVTIEVSRAFVQPPDERELSLRLGTFAVR